MTPFRHVGIAMVALMTFATVPFREIGYTTWLVLKISFAIVMSNR